MTTFDHTWERFSRDNECPNCKSFVICPHVFGAAEVNHMLPAFNEYFTKQKKLPSLTTLAKSGVPGGQGSKGGQPTSKKGPSGRKGII